MNSNITAPDMNPRPSPSPLVWPPILETLQQIAAGHSAPIYLVGGAVRDAYLRRPMRDLDFVVPEDGGKLARRFANALDGAFYVLDEERGVGRAIVEFEGERFVIDVARERGGSLQADLYDRDFTINAIAVDLRGDLSTVVDPLNGINDLSKKIIRACSESSIQTDPIRALRGVRQGVSFGFMIERATREQIRTYGGGIVNTSPERVRDELFKMLDDSRPHVSLRTLDALGLLQLIIPEVTAMKGVTQSAPHVFDVWEHTLQVVEKLAHTFHTISPARTQESASDTAQGMIVYMLDRYRRDFLAHLDETLPGGRSLISLIMYAAIMHDAGKPNTRSLGDDGRIHFYAHENISAELARDRADALHLSREESDRAFTIVKNHMRPMNLHNEASASRRTVYRFWRDTGAAGADVVLLTLGDYLGMVGPQLDLQDWIKHLQTVDPLLDGYFKQRDVIVSPPTLVDGDALMQALNLQPGRKIGELLRLIAEGQAAGEITTVDQALDFARANLK